MVRCWRCYFVLLLSNICRHVYPFPLIRTSRLLLATASLNDNEEVWIELHPGLAKDSIVFSIAPIPENVYALKEEIKKKNPQNSLTRIDDSALKIYPQGTNVPSAWTAQQLSGHVPQDTTESSPLVVVAPDGKCRKGCCFSAMGQGDFSSSLRKVTSYTTHMTNRMESTPPNLSVEKLRIGYSSDFRQRWNLRHLQ